MIHEMKLREIYYNKIKNGEKIYPLDQILKGNEETCITKSGNKQETSFSNKNHNFYQELV